MVTPPSMNTQRNGASDASGAADTPSDGVSAHSPKSTLNPSADPIMVVVDPLPSATATLTLYGGPHPLVPHMAWRPTVTTTPGVTGNGNAPPTSGVDVSLEARNLHTPSPDELPIRDIVSPLPFTTETITLYGGYNPLQPHLTTTRTMTATLGVPAAPPAANTNLPPAPPAVQTDQPPPAANIPATPGTQPSPSAAQTNQPRPPAETDQPHVQSGSYIPKQPVTSTTSRAYNPIDFPHFRPSLWTTITQALTPTEFAIVGEIMPSWEV